MTADEQNFTVIPAEAGIYKSLKKNSHFRGNDKKKIFRLLPPTFVGVAMTMAGIYSTKTKNSP